MADVTLDRQYNSSSNQWYFPVTSTITAIVASPLLSDDVTITVRQTVTYYYYWQNDYWYITKCTIGLRLASSTCSNGKDISNYNSCLFLKDIVSSMIESSNFTVAPTVSSVSYSSGYVRQSGYSWNKLYKNMSTSSPETVATVYFSGGKILSSTNSNPTIEQTINTNLSYYWATISGSTISSLSFISTTSSKRTFLSPAVKFSIGWISTESYNTSGGVASCYYNGLFTLPTLSHVQDTTGSTNTYNISWNCRDSSSSPKIITTKSTSRSSKKVYSGEYWSYDKSATKYPSGSNVSWSKYGKVFESYTENVSEETVSNATVGTIPEVTTKRGYSSQGWYTSVTGSVKVQSSDVITNDNFVFYQQWKAKTYSVNYALAGDGAYYVGGEKPTSISTKTFDASATITKISPKRKGYDFVGWHTNKEVSPSSSAIVRSSDTDAVVGTKLDNMWDDSSSSITLYSIWTPIIHTVQYHYYLEDYGTEVIEKDTFTILNLVYSYNDPKQSRGGDWVLFGWTDVRPDYWGDPTQISDPNNKEWAYGTFKNPDKAPKSSKPYVLTDKIRSMTEAEWEDTTPIDVYGFWTITGKYIKITNTGVDKNDWKKVSVAYYKAADEKWHVINSFGYRDAAGKWHPEVGRSFNSNNRQKSKKKTK